MHPRWMTRKSMKKTISRFSTTCTNRNSGEKLLEVDVRASSLVEAETRGYVACVRAGNNYDDIEVEAKKIEGPSIN